jgi:hypothetical protein
MSENKKTYTPPTITDHGKVTEETKGVVGTTWEVFGTQVVSDGPKG